MRNITDAFFFFVAHWPQRPIQPPWVSGTEAVVIDLRLTSGVVGRCALV